MLPDQEDEGRLLFQHGRTVTTHVQLQRKPTGTASVYEEGEEETTISPSGRGTEPQFVHKGEGGNHDLSKGRGRKPRFVHKGEGENHDLP